MNYRIYDCLPLGKENALNADMLVSMHGLKSERELRHLVERERAQGALILSGNDGYYRPRTREEMIECKARYISMARGIIAIVNLIDNNIIWNVEGRFDPAGIPAEPGSSPHGAWSMGAVMAFWPAEANLCRYGRTTA